MRLARAAMVVAAVALGAHTTALPGCNARTPAGLTPCRDGTVPLLGACVDASVGDAWCGPAARMSASGGCLFRECAADEALDLDGSCVPLGLVVRTGPACAPGGALVVASHRTACIPADDACPRGRRLEGTPRPSPPGEGRNRPPGEGRSCVSSPLPRLLPRLDAPASSPVDVGAWAAAVLGPSGGPGAPETCRPLAQRPDLFGLTPGQALTVSLTVRISVPDEDLSRAYAEVQMRPTVPAAAESLVRQAISTSLEALRGPRRDTATAGVVDLEVACTVRSL